MCPLLVKLSKFQWFQVVLSLVAIIFLVFEVKSEQFITGLKAIDLIWYVWLSLAFFLKYMAKTLKLMALFEYKIPFFKALIITFKYTFYQTIIPFKIGDLTLIGLVEEDGFKSEYTLSTIIVNNVILFTMTSLLLFIFSTATFIFLGIELRIGLLILIILLLIANVILLYLLFSPESFVNLYTKILGAFKLDSYDFSKKTVEFFTKTAESIKSMKENRGQFVRILWYSLLTLISQILVYWVSLGALGYFVHPVETITFSLYIFFIQTLPIELFMSLGIFEVAWAAFWTYLNKDFSDQITKSFIIHSIHILLTILFGIAGWILGFRKQKQKKEQEQEQKQNQEKKEED